MEDKEVGRWWRVFRDGTEVDNLFRDFIRKLVHERAKLYHWDSVLACTTEEGKVKARRDFGIPEEEWKTKK